MMTENEIRAAYRQDAERAAGEAEGRERKKFVEWEDMVAHSRDRTRVPAGSFSR